MRRWELVGRAPVPGAEVELRLYRRDGEYSIRVAGHGELMSSRAHGAEDALGALACERLVGRAGAGVLIGGLGMGFTLAAALARLDADARVEVAELVPEVVRWNEAHLGALAGHPLRDPRVTLRRDDVARVLGGAREAYDAIVLDVDNGPQGLVRRANDALYSLEGLARARGALRPGGTLAVWSAGPDRRFAGRLRSAGFAVEERRVRAHAGKGARYVVWLATAGAQSP